MDNAKKMTYKEAAEILDPETSHEALKIYDGNELLDIVDEACKIAADVLRNLEE